MQPSQVGRLFENLVENAYTAGSNGALLTWLPVLDSHAVDRAVTTAAGGALFIQVKGHEGRRRDGRISQAIPLSAVGDYEGWVAVIGAGTASGLDECYAIPGPELLQKGERGHLVDGAPCVRATLSRDSPSWGEYVCRPDELGARLLSLAGAEPGLAPGPAPEPERRQEEGAFFEAAVVGAILGASERLVLYRPAVDIAGRDLLVQLAGTAKHVAVQVKGSRREDARPGLYRFQVRTRTFSPDIAYVFCAAAGERVEACWVVSGSELALRAPRDSSGHISFEAHVAGPDPRWELNRCRIDDLAERLLGLLNAC